MPVQLRRWFFSLSVVLHVLFLLLFIAPDLSPLVEI